MVNGTVTLVIEELQDTIFIKPSSICNEDAITNNVCVQFNPHHVCDKKGCDCIPQLKQINLNINRVVHLCLTKCNLTTIPNSISELPLKYFDLSYNLLKYVPNCFFTSLNKIHNLNLSNNLIKEFETEPKCVLALRVLDLTNNGLILLPIWIVHVKCSSLEELYFSYNTCDKTNESLYSKVHKYSLKKIVLQNSQIVNENVPFIKSIETAEYLDISNNLPAKFCNTLTNYDELFDTPSWKNNLSVLNLSNLGMGFLPNNMFFIFTLKELYLSQNAILVLPDFIGKLTNLEVLDISKNCICFLPSTVTALVNLRTLNLQYNNLADVHVLETINLDILDLYENDLDSFNLDVLKYKGLDLERNCFETNLLQHDYITRRDSYRKKFNLYHRDICRRDYVDIMEDVSSSVSEASEAHVFDDDEYDDRNVTPDQHYVEECWDDAKFQSHPDVTSSDEEWQGYMPTQKKNQQQKENLDHLLEYLYVDVD